MSDRGQGDNEFVNWLAQEIMGVPNRNMVRLGGFFPLTDLNHARLLEDRLRELGLGAQYKNTLVSEARKAMQRAAWEKYQSVAVWPDGFDDAMAVLEADARTRCLAVRRTFEAHQGASYQNSVAPDTQGD